MNDHEYGRPLLPPPRRGLGGGKQKLNLSLGDDPERIVQRFVERFPEPTRRNLVGSLKRWLTWCDQRGVVWQTADADDIQTWGATLTAQGFATLTVRGHLSVARRFHHWLWETGARPDDAGARVKLPRRERNTQWVWLGRGELAKLVQVARRHSDPNIGCAALMWALSGLRLSEPLRVDVPDLSWHEGRVTVGVRRSKRTGHDRIALPDTTAELALECAEGRRGGPLLRGKTGGRLNPDVARKGLKLLCREAGVPVATPQGLRVGWITLCLAAGIPERLVSISAGHSSSRTTALYDARRGLVERAAGVRLADWLETPAAPETED